MKNLITLIILFFLLDLQAQFTFINTGTSTNLQISVFKNNIFINGQDNYLKKSIDECNTLLSLNAPSPAGYQNYLHRLDTTNAFMLSTNFGVYNNKLYKTSDGGYNWIKTSDTSGLIFTQYGFFDSNEGVAISTSNKMFRTKNGGASWVLESQPFAVCTSVTLFSDSLISLGGANGGVGGFYISKDRGHTWPLVTGFGQLSYSRDVCFLSKDTIFGVSSKGWWGPFFKTSFDGGISWGQVVIPLIHPNGICFKKFNEGYVVGMQADSSSTILKTTDLGQTWTTINIPIKSQLLTMSFINDSIALVSGTGGVLFKWNTKSPLNATAIKSNNFENLQVNISPNPFNNKLTIDLNNVKTLPLEIIILNTLGQTVFSLKELQVIQEVDLSFLSSGIYYLKVWNQDGQQITKILKSN